MMTILGGNLGFFKVLHVKHIACPHYSLTSRRRSKFGDTVEGAGSISANNGSLTLIAYGSSTSYIGVAAFID